MRIVELDKVALASLYGGFLSAKFIRKRPKVQEEPNFQNSRKTISK